MVSSCSVLSINIDSWCLYAYHIPIAPCLLTSFIPLKSNQNQFPLFNETFNKNEELIAPKSLATVAIA